MMKKCVLNVCQAGNELLCAGYTLYSSATILVLTVGEPRGGAAAGGGRGRRRALPSCRSTCSPGRRLAPGSSHRTPASLPSPPASRPRRQGRVRLHL